MATGRHSRAGLAVLTVAAAAMAFLMLRPFATALFLAAVMAAALDPWAARLAQGLGGRRGLACGLLTLALVVAVLGPVATVATVVGKQVAGGINWLREALQSEGIHGLVKRLPESAQSVAERVLAELPRGADDIQALVESEGTRAAAALSGILSATGTVLLQLILFLIAFFFLLRDGRRLAAWLRESAPLKPGQAAELLLAFRRVTVAVLVSTLATAGVQTVAALTGYLIAGVPTPVFFAIVTFLLALIPVPAATALVLTLAVLRLATGHTFSGVFLAAWGIGVVGSIDNFVKPIFMKGQMEIHGAVVFFSFLGGLAAFGPVGLLVGPLVVSFVIAVARLYRRDFGGSR
jgi:predicted PurR-regulated permease PerM